MFMVLLTVLAILAMLLASPVATQFLLGCSFMALLIVVSSNLLLSRHEKA